jgi:amino acid transporter
VFLAVTYYFSKIPSKNTRQLWDITLSLLIVSLVALFLVTGIFPQVASDTYSASQVYVRVFIVICLSYIAIHTLRSHIKNPDPTTIWVPMGYILLAISQYSLLFWYLDNSLAAFTGSLALRLMALAVFLAVTYLSFKENKRTGK